MKYEDISKLLVAIAPPKNVVNLIPIRSTSTPAMGDIRNVVPTVKEPTNAKNDHDKNFFIKFKNKQDVFLILWLNFIQYRY